MKRALCLMFAAGIISFDSSAGTISGTVKDSVDGRPLVEATISGNGFASYKKTTSDSLGNFTFTYEDAVGTIANQNASSTANLDYNASKRSIAWSGNLSKINIQIFNVKGGLVLPLSSSARSGALSIGGLAASSYLIKVEMNGQRSDYRLLNLPGQGFCLAGRKTAAIKDGSLAKGAAAGKTLIVGHCGYKAQYLPVIGNETNLAVQMPRTASLTTCPTNTDTVSWSFNTRSLIFPGTVRYGQWHLFQEGYDGSAKECTRLVRDCNWKIYKNHTGGYGGTYQAISEDSSAIFVWSYGVFSQFTATERWKGKTDKGLGIGDSASKFLAAYPLFKPKLDSLSKIRSAAYIDSFHFFNRRDSLFRSLGPDTMFLKKDSTYLDTSKHYNSYTRFGVVGEFDAAEKLKRLTCYLWDRFL